MNGPVTGLVWRRSSRCEAANCVEVAEVPPSRCESGDCVEVADLPGGGMAVRNSKDPGGPVLTFTAAEWDAFVAGVRVGEFDLDG